MHFPLIAAALLSATTVYAADHAVAVGANGLLAFDPTDIQAAAGDTITFSFLAKNHSVTQSTFAAPCTKSGLDSGFHLPVAGGTGATDFPTFVVTVNDTSPLWFYCAQTNPVVHCPMGMVFAVNAPADKSFAAFQSNAKATSNANSTAGGSPYSTTGPTTNSTTGSTNSTTGSTNSNTGSNTGSGTNNTSGGNDDGGDNNTSRAVKLNGGVFGALAVASVLTAFL
ncbi:hypothetical protein D9613_002977 [Agrocybe pediades]|uniref:Cupredoxin n=1 Tax=Agrocybe pediades TaxID=84607 RepID=A0A8H4QQ18_9AGAR|nr:hypothetical protein D9613_002977 [Agrocybe pediades]